MATDRPALRILTVTDYFLPGFNGGGPVRTLSNLFTALAGELEFSLLTRDRDHGHRRPYPGVEVDAWTRRDGYAVRYASPRGRTPRALREVLARRPHDVLYLNSLFSSFTRRILVLRRLGLVPRRPTVLAPRGELSPGALRLKAARKAAYLAAVRRAGLCDGVVFQASTPLERDEIRAVFGPGARVEVAPDLSLGARSGASPAPPAKEPGAASLVFLSRVSPKKNLLAAIEALHGVPGRVTLDVYGNLEDEGYWERCRKAAAALPPEVKVEYRGHVPPDRVEETFAAHHFFLFPTRGENFGHVIAEALRAGCPVLLSDRTPWRGLAAARAGWDVPLEDPAALRAALAEAVAMDGPTWAAWADGARAFAETSVCADEARDAYLRLFRRAAAGA